MITKLFNRVVITEVSEFREAQEIQAQERAAGKKRYAIQYRGEAKKHADAEDAYNASIDWDAAIARVRAACLSK